MTFTEAWLVFAGVSCAISAVFCALVCAISKQPEPVAIFLFVVSCLLAFAFDQARRFFARSRQDG